MSCETCGRLACICPKCPVCGEAGNLYCYRDGPLKMTREQGIGVLKRHILLAEERLAEKREILQHLENHPVEPFDARALGILED